MRAGSTSEGHKSSSNMDRRNLEQERSRGIRSQAGLGQELALLWSLLNSQHPAHSGVSTDVSN